ncbi:hypothetical protein FCOIX_13971 [Fusarium coicis]|nr:hypothetical protein FCOIX_13971 [Fusarium coicis]
MILKKWPNRSVLLLMVTSTPIPALTISLARYLHGYGARESLAEQWPETNVPASTSSHFDNIGFDLDEQVANLGELESQLREREWGGITVGW